MAETKTTKEAKQETYKITLPLTEQKQDDVHVGLNGMVYTIQRGEEVEVPAGVYEILKNSEQMDALALKRRRNLASK